MSDIPSRLKDLRGIMKKEKLDAYIVPSTDDHGSEYVPHFWKRREWISGFTGSAGDVCITATKAGLWTDGRYFLQAEEQLRGSGITLFKMGVPKTPEMKDWLSKVLKKGARVGIDPKVISVEAAAKLQSTLANHGLVLSPVEGNFIDMLWKDQPPVSKQQVYVWGKKYAGEAVSKKLERLRKVMKEKGADAHVLTALDSIAWLFNLRGKDIDYNPLFISYAIVTNRSAVLFIDSDKLPKSAMTHLKGTVRVAKYEDFAKELLGLQKSAVLLDPKTASRWVNDRLMGARIIKDRSPVVDFKSVKNDTEIRGFRISLERDGVAFVKWLKWLSEEVPKGKLTEWTAAEKLREFFSQGTNYMGLSFTTISGYAHKGAVIHYSTNEDTAIGLKPRGIYLVDSGVQYLDGTTDCTRTIALGKVTNEQRDRFTRVLKGHIQLAMLRFPEGTQGKSIDVLSRLPLWKAGLNFNHGTGHGVGSHLNVHEGPMSISPRDPGVPLKEGNVLTNEPGFYKEGGYGIRIENIILTVKDEKFSNDDRKWMRFETLTMVPIDTGLVIVEMLTDAERDWLNTYHRTVRRVISPFLDKEHRKWLKAATEPI